MTVEHINECEHDDMPCFLTASNIFINNYQIIDLQGLENTCGCSNTIYLHLWCFYDLLRSLN